MEESDFIWMDGELVEWEEAKIHVLSHGLHYGTGVFEGIRAYEQEDNGSAVFRLEEHMDRFIDSAKITNIDLGYSKKELIEAVENTIKENKLKKCYIRPIAFRGYSKLGVNPREVPVKVVIAVWPWGAYLGEDAIENGVSVKTSSWSRHHPNVMPTKAKATGNYVNSALAKSEVNKDGYDEALMLTPEGNVAEGTGENLFIVRNGKLYTPPSSSVLEGITRKSIIQLAEDESYTVKEEKITRDQVYRADEAFFVGTAAEVTPIASVDNRKISNGRGEITNELQNKFMELVKGRVEKYKGWLHRVEQN
ncbi:MAG: branched-chain amino acid transaminase [Candidatus Nanohaloarchaeota archaeon QJJ-9]|nr:branched-chain amino acid transaminase [Candidatus Nanohaloarchaeota archaeon QJJ-9]